MKVCRVCKVEKPTTEFHRCKQTRDGLHFECKPCRSEENRARRLANHDLHLARGRVYRERNRVNDNIARRRWRENNREKQAALVRAWYEKNVERRNSTVRNYRARKKAAGGTHGKKDIERLVVEQSGMCAKCDVQLRRYHVDHIMPLFHGGSNGPENLQLLCPDCNYKKWAHIPSSVAA